MGSALELPLEAELLPLNPACDAVGRGAGVRACEEKTVEVVRGTGEREVSLEFPLD